MTYFVVSFYLVRLIYVSDSPIRCSIELSIGDVVVRTFGKASQNHPHIVEFLYVDAKLADDHVEKTTSWNEKSIFCVKSEKS